MINRVKPSDNLFDFFHESINGVRADMNVDLTQDTFLYLASLLAERARTDTQAMTDSTLAELYGKAAHAEPSTQVRVYRELGDRALYQLGFFNESMTQLTVGESYYRQMGAAAYYQVDQTFKRWFADAFGPVFVELAKYFSECVNLLTRVRQTHDGDQPEGLLRLYKDWLETRSEEKAKQLRMRGIIVSSIGEGVA